MPSKSFVFWTIVIVAFLLITWSLQSMLAPFIFGVLLAYLMNPLVKMLTFKTNNRWAAATFILFVLVSLLLMLFVFVIPYVAIQIYNYMGGLGEYLQDVNEEVSGLIEHFSGFISEDRREELLKNVTSQMGTVLTWLGELFQSILSRAI